MSARVMLHDSDATTDQSPATKAPDPFFPSPKAFVGNGTDIYIIRKGDTLDGKFLVASIDPTSVKLKEPISNLKTSLDLTKAGGPGAS